VESAGDPDGDGDRNEEVSGVGVDDNIHIRPFPVNGISVLTEKIVTYDGKVSSLISKQ
jgi:hypothetical protein